MRDAEGGEVLSGAAVDGSCRVVLPLGRYWVKAQAPGMRSVPIRVAEGVAPGAALRLQPLQGADAKAQQRLAEMVQHDQAVREALGDAERTGDAAAVQRAEQALAMTDTAHRAEMARWLREKGFPRMADVGYDGVGAFWLLLQHAPDLLEGQLPALRAAVAAGELSRADLALSEDRVDLLRGRPQRYGSQLRPGPDGKLEPYWLADPESVDARRAAMDLEPLAAYLKRFER
ncbi:MAG: hypothetical protein C0460_01770 [Methylibium sp.]|nr:hypothetical protein [Methylibium sp.]MBY0366317.1 hypothetical protein [Burkholderiaceae bacterium]